MKSPVYMSIFTGTKEGAIRNLEIQRDHMAEIISNARRGVAAGVWPTAKPFWLNGKVAVEMRQGVIVFTHKPYAPVSA